MRPTTAAEGAPRTASARAGGWEFADAPARTVDVEGAAIRYRLWDLAGPDAPTLLFLHGFRAHSRWWDHIVPFFWHRYRVATMDFSGLGDSGWRDTYTARTFAREVLAVIDAANLAPVTIIAHSFGGSPAAFAAALEPAAIARAILIDSRMILAGVPPPERREIEAFTPGKRVYADLDELRRRYRLVPTSGPVDPELLDHVAYHSGRPERDGWTWKFDERFDAELASDPERTVPPQLTTPLDYIYGDASNVVSPALVALIVALLPTCREPIVIPRSDHHILLEQPLALVAALRALLAGGPRAPG